MIRSIPLLAVIVFVFVFVSQTVAQENSFKYIDGNRVAFEYNGKPYVFDVWEAVWLGNDAYFETNNGDIYRWGDKIAENSFGLRKEFNKIYFLTQLGDDAEWYGTLLTKIEKDKPSKTYEILGKDGKKINTEFYAAFGSRIVIEKFDYEICVLGEDGREDICFKTDK